MYPIFFYSQSDGLTMRCLVVYGGRNFFPKIYIVDITKSCHGFKNRTGRSDRFNREPASNLVRLWQKTGNTLKTFKQWKPTGSTWKSEKPEVEPVLDRLGDFHFFLLFRWKHYVVFGPFVLKSNPKPKVTQSLLTFKFRLSSHSRLKQSSSPHSLTP